MEEKWKPITGFEGDYEVSDLGNIKRISPDRMGRTTHVGKLIQPMRRANGYAGCCLWKNGRPHPKLFHRVVAEAFLGPRGSNTTNHKNGIKTDSRLENLEYVTHSENYRHALNVLGFKPARGMRHHSATISDALIVEICRRLDRGEKGAHLAREFGVGNMTMSNYKRRIGRAKDIPYPLPD